MLTQRVISGTSSLLSSFSTYTSGLYGWGLNTKGSLGLGDSNNHFLPKHINIDSIKDIAVGIEHSVLLTNDGDVYTVGDGKYFKLGHGDENSSLKPKKVEGLPPITSISCGHYHTVAVTQDGQVYSWGWGGSLLTQGALGHGNKDTVTRPKNISSLDKYKIISTSCGELHTLALTSDGKLFTFGKGEYGRLGLGSSGFGAVSSPELVEFFDYQNKKVISISSGHAFNLVKTEDNKLWSFGKNEQGQLGIGPSLTLDMSACENIPAPVLFDKNINIKTFACGSTHAVAVSNEGNTYVWGEKRWTSPLHVKSLSNIEQVAAGKGVTVAVNDKGESYIWSVFGKRSSFFNEKANHYESTPKLIENFKNVKKVKAYEGNLMAII